MSNWSSASKVLSTIQSGDTLHRIRSENRVKVNRAANCMPPLSAELCQQMGIKINVEWGELANTLKSATRQMVDAFTSSQNFFTVRLPNAPEDKQSEWEAIITDEINKPLRKSLKYFELHRSRWSSVITHGVGPMAWMDDENWLPRFVSMNDLRIPTDTTIDFANLSWFAVRIPYTPGELLREVFNDNPGNRWNKEAIKAILSTYKEINVTMAGNNYNFQTDPERFLELFKQNGGFWDGDAMPSIPLYHFYFLDEDKDQNEGWYMAVVPEIGSVTGAQNDKFLWSDMTKPFADDLAHILHCQFGDLTADAPFKYHAVRSLGFMLLEPTFYRNLTRNRWLQHIHDNFNVWLRSTDPVGKARAQIMEFANNGVVPPGLTVIPENERHQVNGNNVESVMADLKQLMSESSSSYTQQQDTGTNKEQTAFETRVKTEQVSAMLGGILNCAFKYETYADQEIARRFCIKDSKNKDVKKFQNKCKERGVPMPFLDIDQWEVEPVTPLGSGNATIAQAAAQQLMNTRGAYSPEAQQEILHDYTLVVTKDWRKASRLAPIGEQSVTTKGGIVASSLFGTLMTGVQVPPPQGVSPMEQIDAMLPLLAGKIVQMEQRDNMADFGEAAGLQSVEQYLGMLIQQLSQDPQNADKVKQYGDALGKLQNQTKGLVQRGAAAAKSGQEGATESIQMPYDSVPEDIKRQMEQKAGFTPSKMTPEQINAANPKTIATAQTASDRQALTAQQLHHKDAAFQAEQARKDAQAAAEIQRQDVKTTADLAIQKKTAEQAPKPAEPASV